MSLSLHPADSEDLHDAADRRDQTRQADVDAMWHTCVVCGQLSIDIVDSSVCGQCWIEDDAAYARRVDL